MTDTNYTPTTQEVGAFLRARLVDDFNNHKDDFDDTTSPTQEEAQELIDAAADEVSEEIGTEVAPSRVSQAKRLVQLLAAANIEMSFFPEQAAANNSMYDKLMARYNTLLPKFGEDIGEDDQGPVSGGSFGGFPASSGFGTRQM